jgi:hypothetical protein
MGNLLLKILPIILAGISPEMIEAMEAAAKKTGNKLDDVLVAVLHFVKGMPQG